VALGEGPEFKPQYCKNKSNNKKKVPALIQRRLTKTLNTHYVWFLFYLFTINIIYLFTINEVFSLPLGSELKSDFFSLPNFLSFIFKDARGGTQGLCMLGGPSLT
jgi:hypothetical protein